MEKTFSVTRRLDPKENIIPGPVDLENNEIRGSNQRSMTDAIFLILMTLFLIVLCIFLGYCIFYSDIFRIISGYDNCGNVCGKKATSIKTNHTGNCTVSNENYPFHLVMRRKNTNIQDRFCVRNCSDFIG